MICRCCGAVLPDDSVFCECCGTNLSGAQSPVPVCPACGMPPAAGSAFCGNCGARISAASVCSVKPEDVPPVSAGNPDYPHALMMSQEKRQKQITRPQSAVPVCPGRFCRSCGAELDGDAVFCESCGAPAEGTPAGSAAKTQKSESGPLSESAYAQTSTWSAAAKIAVERNIQQEWSYWDDADNFDYTPKSLLRFCEKEDERLADWREEEEYTYVVSPDGSIGQFFVDDAAGDGGYVFEWVFYTRECNPEEMPRSYDEIKKLLD